MLIKIYGIHTFQLYFIKRAPTRNGIGVILDEKMKERVLEVIR